MENFNFCAVCIVWYYWYFLDIGFKFQENVCNGCHHKSMVSISLSDIAILNIHGYDYRFISNRVSKIEAVNLLQKFDLNEKSGIL